MKRKPVNFCSALRLHAYRHFASASRDVVFFLRCQAKAVATEEGRERDMDAVSNIRITYTRALNIFIFLQNDNGNDVLSNASTCAFAVRSRFSRHLREQVEVIERERERQP